MLSICEKIASPSSSSNPTKNIQPNDEHLVDVDSEIKDPVLFVVDVLHMARVLQFNAINSSRDTLNVLAFKLVEVEGM